VPTQPLFNRPTTVFIGGNNRPLLNWVAYGLALDANPEFLWTDVRIPGELFDRTDILARSIIPSDRLTFVYPSELARTSAPPASGTPAPGSTSPSSALSPSEALRQLPVRSQQLLASLPAGGPPVPVVLSNAHRILALYPADTVGPILRAIVSAGAIFLMTFADSPPEGRRQFETVLHVNGPDPPGWGQATLRIEKSPVGGPFKTGSEVRLREIPAIADVLSTAF